MSLFSVMNVGQKALYASQLGMEVTAQNLANADVKGYSRKRINVVADYHRHGTYGQFGFGVSVVNISRIRSEHIDAQIRRQSHELGKHQAINYALESMENILREPSETGILEYMNKFWDSWEALANNPSDKAARTSLQANTNMLTDVFHNIASELETLKATRNQEMLSIVNKINTITEEIFNLNGEISLVHLQGQMPNDSLDRRDQLMRELSELINFESQVSSNGEVTISVSGNLLVTPTGVNRLEIFEDSTTRTNPGADYHQFGIRMEKGKNLISPTGGQLAGVIEARDVTIPKMQAQLDELAKGLVTAVNAQHRVGFNLNGFTGFDFFDPTGVTASTIKLSASIRTNVDNIAAAGGADAPIRATANNFSSNLFWDNYVDTTGKTVYELKTPPVHVQLTKDGRATSATPPGEPARNIVAGSVTLKSKSTGVTLPQELEGIHYRIDYANGTIEMLTDEYGGHDFEINFSFSNPGGWTGIGNNANAIAMSELRKAVTMGAGILGEKTSTFDQFYGSAIAELGLARKEAMANVETREYLIGQYDSHQDSIAGVDPDEEMANLIKYQYTYQAAARIFTTAQSMLDILMNI